MWRGARTPGSDARSSRRIPSGSEWRFEVKWDGFRALVSTVGSLRIRSRHGWSMARRLPELADLPAGLVLDGELVVWGEDGLPSFPLLQRRILHDQREIPLMFLAFDVLAIDGGDTMRLPCAERRRLLEGLDLSGPAWHTPCAFEDGEALFATVCERGLEGIVGKRALESYRPGERRWIKIKNRGYWRHEQELEAIAQKGRRELGRYPLPGGL